MLVLAQRGCASHAGLALSLTAEFAPVRLQRAEAAFDELACLLAGRATTGPQRSSTPPPTSPARISKRSRWTARSRTCCSIASSSTAPATRCRWPSPPSRPAAGLALGVVAGADGAFVAAERLGHIAWALRAAELRLVLPFEGGARERLEAELRRVRARLN